jgi:hypothetical protein
MLRTLLTVLCLGTGLFCFANEDNRASCELSEDSNPFLYIGHGVGNVLEYNHDVALCYLATGESLLNDSDKLKPAADFIIAFTRAVIYDNLGWQDKREQALGKLVLIAAENDYNKTFCVLEEQEIMKRLLRETASRAPTVAVKAFLLVLLEEDDKEDTYR